MMKGQAFSTFKLMIAAVVAVAILGILLSILGGIQSPVGFEQQAKNLLNDVSDSTGVMKEGSTVTITPGSYPSSTFDSAAGKDVEYNCPDSVPGDIVDGCSSSNLDVDSDWDVTLSACCESGTCYLGLNNQPSC